MISNNTEDKNESRPQNLRRQDEESTDAERGSTLSDEQLIPALARSAVETYARERRIISMPLLSSSSMLHQKAACFVSIKTIHGDLRGCIGTVEPAMANLGEEIVMNAVRAATADPRFMPVTESELQFLTYSVDVLSSPEPTQFEELDPKIYGVIVEDSAATHRGLLLPDIEGIETVEQQVEIAARKAGIMPGTPLNFYRFRVRRFREALQQGKSA